MKNLVKKISTILISVLTLVMMFGTVVSADGSRLDYFDFGETVIKINAGESKTISLRTPYKWTYFVEGATSKKTYIETDFASGSSQITFHIGEDETGKNVFFHFYVADERVQSTDVHDCVEIYVQPPKGTAAAAPVAEPVVAPAQTGKVNCNFADGSSGYVALINDGKVAMLYDAAGTGLASFSVSTTGLQNISVTGVVSNGGNYFSVTGPAGGKVNISDSDKAVMTAKGFAGISLNGTCINWP